MQAAGDMLLGWLRFEGPDGQRREFYVRQLWDGKGSAEVDAMGPEALEIYAQLCGWTPRTRPRAVGRRHRDRLLPREGQGLR